MKSRNRTRNLTHPNTIDPRSARAALPLGHWAGGYFGFDLAGKPHALITGQPGAGKTNALRILMREAAARGFELKSIPGEVDYLTGRRFEEVHAEIARRRAILEDAGAGSWADLDETAREAEGLRPLLVIVDGAVRKGYLNPGVVVGDHLERIVAAASGTGVHLAVSREAWAWTPGEAFQAQSAEIELVRMGEDAHGGQVRLAGDMISIGPRGEVQLSALAAA